jgi:hypothetical protein
MTGAKMEGILKRKNRHGEWKERYCKFSSTQFLGYKTAKGKATNELKECYNLKEIATVESNAKGQLLVTLLNGEQSLFKGDNIDRWKQAFLDLSEEANEMHQETLAYAAGDGKSVSISGILLKQSHNKYQGYQERFVRLEGTSLKYYKKEGEPQEQGSINIFFAAFIRSFNDEENCKIFEIADQDDRVYAFQARSHSEMMRWIQTLNTVRTAALDRSEEEKAAKLEAETPERVRFFDNEGEEAFKELFREQLMEMYPDPETLIMTIKMHIQYATEIVQYLKDLIPELQAVGTRPARYDILAVAMTETNFVLYERFRFFLEPTFDDGTNDEGNNYLHDILEGATLGDLHALINWISKYQSTLRTIRCPVGAPDTVAVTSQARLSTTHLNPKQCDMFNFIQRICKLYVHGGSSGAKGGAAEHLTDHCQKVWNAVESNPEEMLQRHNNGTFFTEAPIQMWLTINQHISLATSTNSPILHVMIAEKVVTSLIGVFEHIIHYIQTLDTSQRPELREIELEYMSALANDTALHIEDVIELIENFTIPEIREKIDEIFDPLTTTLFQCGQACLKRLAGLVMADVQGLLDQVFEEEWMEGNQMRVATATISDYMRDFQEFLVPFWADKFVMTILEEVIVSYTRTLLFRKDKKKSVTTTVTTTANEHAPGSPSVGGMFSSFFQKTKQTITQTITTQVPTHVPVDEESLGRLAQDVNILNAFFSLKAGQEIATEFLALINEVSLLLFIDVPGIIQHIAVRVSEYPSAAQAIRDVSLAVMRLRYEDFTKADLDYVSQQVQEVLQTAPADAQRREAEGIVEGRLGLLYCDVVPKDPNAQSGKQALTLTQRMRVMAHIPLFGAAARTIIGEEDADEQPSEKHEGEDVHVHGHSKGEGAGDRLLKDVLHVLNEQEPDSLEQDNEYAREQVKKEAEEAARKAKLLYYDGYLEKKSPAHNLWQRRFYKLMTREIDDKFLYSLLWYKKEGGSLIKALEVEKIASMAVLVSARNMAYVMPPKSQLMLMSEAAASGLSRCAIPIVELDHEENRNEGKNAHSVVKQEYFAFLITQTDGKEHVLRGLKVDRVMKWINMLAQAGGFAYDSASRTWTRPAFLHFKTLEREGRLPLPDAPPTARRRNSSTSTIEDSNIAAPHGNSNNNIPVSSSSPRLTTNPKQVRGSFVGGTTALSGSNKVAVKDLMQSLQNDGEDASQSGSSVSRSGTQDEWDSTIDRRTRSGTTGSTGSASVQYYDDDAAAVAAKLRSPSAHSVDTPALSPERLAQLQAAADNRNKGSDNDPFYLSPEEENAVAAESATTTPRRRGSSVAQLLTAITSSLTSPSSAAGESSTQTTNKQQQSLSPPPPPPASSSPMASSPRPKNAAAAALSAADNSDEEEVSKTQKRPSSAETANPLFRTGNTNLVDSPTQSGTKRVNASTDNTPMTTSRSSITKSIRTAPPPPPPPSSSPPPPVINVSSNYQDVEDRDSMFNDRETQAWPSSSNLPAAGSPSLGTQPPSRKSSISKRAVKNLTRQAPPAASTDNDSEARTLPDDTEEEKSLPSAQPPVTGRQNNVTPKLASAATKNHVVKSVSSPPTVAARAQQPVERDNDLDRFSVMTVDLDSSSPSSSPKSTVTTGTNSAGKKRVIQSFEVQDSPEHHRDNERLLNKDKKQAGCPCVVS